MLKVGITGGIGSGKSMVCEIFKKIGVPVYHADLEARNLMASNAQIIDQLTRIFGKKIYRQNKLDRERLAALIFNDEEKIQKVNSIVHPIVFEHFFSWVELQKEHTYVIKEAAILFESGAYKHLDKIITITAPEALKIKRVMERDNVIESEVRNRMKNQLDEEEKIKRSDYVIINDNKQLLIPQILDIHATFMGISSLF